jgi:hypothetical protein
MNARVSLLLLVVVLTARFLNAGAQPPTARRTATRTFSVDAERALPMTCVQAWSASGKRYPQMLAIVTTLAKVSLANRNLTFPNTRQAGLDAGKGIADDCKADPNALLFAIVDKHVRRVASAGQ